VVVKSSHVPRRWAVEREPARKQRPERSGTAPREGKALKGDSSGRERHGTRPRSVGASRRTAGSARSPCVPRTWPEPSRGARTLRTAPVGVWQPSPATSRSSPHLHRKEKVVKVVSGSNGAPGVQRSREQEPQERRSRPQGPRTGCVSGHRDT